MAKATIVGAGAIGGIIAARMAMQGHQVSVVARGAHLQAIAKQGLTLDDRLTGQRHTVDVAHSDDPAEFGIQDLVVIGLKGPAIPDMLPRLSPLLGPDTVVVPAINGVPWWYFHRAGGRFDGARITCLDPAANLASALPLGHVVGCVVHLAGMVAGPGVVVHTANRNMIVGEPAGGSSDRVKRLADWWNRCDMTTRVSEDIRFDIWTKLLGNLAFNTVAALTGCRTDQMIDDPAIRELLRTLMDEGRGVAQAYGVDGLMDSEQRIDMARSIGRARPSTLQDFDNGRRPEIEGLIGSVIELAQWQQVPVPTVRYVAALLTAKARAAGLID